MSTHITGYLKHSRLLFILLFCISTGVYAPAAQPALQDQPEQQAVAPQTVSLIERLTNLKTDDERSALLQKEPNLLTAELVDGLRKQGYKLFIQGQTEKGLSSYMSALLAAKMINDKGLMAKANNSLGFYNQVTSNFPLAAKYYQQSIDLAREAGDKAQLAVAMSELANIDRIQGNYSPAIQRLEEALTLARESSDGGVIEKVAERLVVTYAARGDFIQALKYAQLNLEVVKQYKLPIVTTAYSTLGEIYIDLGDYDRALEVLKIALDTAPKSDPHYKGQALQMLSKAHLELGNYALAQEYGQQTVKIAEGLRAPGTYAAVLSQLAETHIAQGNISQGLEMYAECLKIADKTHITQLQLILNNNLADAYLLKKDYEKSKKYAQAGLDLARATGTKPQEWVSLIALGDINQMEIQYSAAEDYYLQALKLAEEMKNDSLIARSLAELASIYYLQGKSQQALGSSTQSAELAKRMGMSETLWRAQTALGQAYASMKQPQQALKSFKDAVETIEKLTAQVSPSEKTRQRYFESKTAPYNALVKLSLERDDKWGALQYAEKTKARVMGDILKNGHLNPRKFMSTGEVEQERALEYQLVSLNTQLKQEFVSPQKNSAIITDIQNRLDKARAELEKFETTLYSKQPLIAVQRAQIPPIVYSDALKLLNSISSTVIAYVLAENHLIIFILDSSKDSGKVTLNVYSSPVDEKKLSEEISVFRTQVGERDISFSKRARDLYDQLIKPVEHYLVTDKTICIIPDGSLWELPFQALQRDSDTYLLDRHPLFYAHSISVLNEMRKNEEDRNNTAGKSQMIKVAKISGQAELFAVVNPEIASTTVARAHAVRRDLDLGPLPEAEREVAHLKTLFGRGNSLVISGSEAQEETVKRDAPNYRILHFATHGIFDDRSPLYSNLVLATRPGNTSEDGLLEAWEVMRLNINANLVTLSACETARGHLSRGEGLVGMSWAFFVAGSSSLIASQWKVDSASTSDLMVKMYTYMREGPASPAVKARSLQRAAVDLRRNSRYELPYYWAGFILLGNPN